MLSEKYRFLFIHRPKSAGNSIGKALLPYTGEKMATSPYHDGVDEFLFYHPVYNTQKHTPLSHYRQVLPPQLYDSLYKFAVLRNPYDRLVSAFFGPHRVVRGHDTVFTPEKFEAHIRKNLSLREFICLQESSRLDADIDKILRFETLQEDFDQICARVGLARIALPHLNRGQRNEYRQYYTPELRRLVEQRFGDELEYGRYIF